MKQAIVVLYFKNKILAIHQSILQILVSGLATAASEPAPQWVFSISVGASLTDIIPRVGAQSKVQPENPENVSGSIQDEKVLVRCNAVEISPFSTQVTNSASHSYKKYSKINQISIIFHEIVIFYNSDKD